MSTGCPYVQGKVGVHGCVVLAGLGPVMGEWGPCGGRGCCGANIGFTLCVRVRVCLGVVCTRALVGPRCDPACAPCRPLWLAWPAHSLHLHFRGTRVTQVVAGGLPTTFRHRDLLHQPVVKVAGQPCSMDAYNAMFRWVTQTLAVSHPTHAYLPALLLWGDGLPSTARSLQRQ